MRFTRLLAVCSTAAALSVGTAAADTMHPELGARLSGMGEHGIVNLTLKASHHEICWTFEIPTKGPTAASIRDGHGMLASGSTRRRIRANCGVRSSSAWRTCERSTMTDDTHRIGRGVFLATVAGGLSSLVWGKPVWSRVTGVVSPVAETLVPVLPSSGWRIYSVAAHLPTFDPVAWRLDVGGLVERPMTLDYGALRRLPRTEQVSTFHCVTGWTVKNVRWAGVRIGDVIGPAGPRPGAKAIRFVSAEQPYVDYLTLDQARLHDVLLAYEMDGRPLSRGHGAPLRLVIPEMYGYKNVKWLARIELVHEASAGYWEALGYDRDAWVGRSNGYGT